MNIRKALPADFDSSWHLTSDPDFKLISGIDVSESKEMHFVWYATVLNDPSAILLFAEDDGDIVGQVLVKSYDKEGAIFVVTAPSQRGKGYGRSMIREATVIAKRELDITELKARIAKNVNGALNAFLNCGFSIVDSKSEAFITVIKYLGSEH